MQSKTKNIFKNVNINNFACDFCEVIKQATQTFWEQDVDVVLYAINDFIELRNEKLIKNIDFFTSQIKVEYHKPVIVRLSSDFAQDFLDISLQQKDQMFHISRLTPLETQILNGYCEFLYKRINDVLLPVKEVKVSEKSEKNINLLFMIVIKDEVCSKIMISIPQDRFKFVPLKQAISFKDEDFFTSSATVNLKAGSSKITFDELQNLSIDDIVVLETSELSKMTLISGDVKEKFNIKINPSLIMNLNNDEDEEEDDEQIYEEVNMAKNLWDDIQIEMNAEFEKVKMTIGELKQISQGQIVDLGSILENEISLFVEDRKVAKGELIIINDRYAVRLNEVLTTNPPAAQAQPRPAQPQQAQAPHSAQAQPQPRPAQAQQAQAPRPAQAQPRPAQAQPQPRPAQGQVQPRPVQSKASVQAENEEFDYSDFEK